MDKFAEWIESVDFDVICYAYRVAPMSDPARVAKNFAGLRRAIIQKHEERLSDYLMEVARAALTMAGGRAAQQSRSDEPEGTRAQIQPIPH